MTTSSASHPAPPTSTVVATWKGGRRYDIARPGGPATSLDGSGETGTGPVDTMLGALASCSAIDVEDYLTKRRTPPDAMTVTVEAERRAEHPRRIMAARLTYAIGGASVDPAHAARAVQLSLERYCSVSASLAPDLAITTAIVVNGVTVTPGAEASGT